MQRQIFPTRPGTLLRSYVAGDAPAGFECNASRRVLGGPGTSWAKTNSAPAGLDFAQSLHHANSKQVLPHALQPTRNLRFGPFQQALPPSGAQPRSTVRA